MLPFTENKEILKKIIPTYPTIVKNIIGFYVAIPLQFCLAIFFLGLRTVVLVAYPITTGVRAYSGIDIILSKEKNCRILRNRRKPPSPKWPSSRSPCMMVCTTIRAPADRASGRVTGLSVKDRPGATMENGWWGGGLLTRKRAAAAETQSNKWETLVEQSFILYYGASLDEIYVRRISLYSFIYIYIYINTVFSLPQLLYDPSGPIFGFVFTVSRAPDNITRESVTNLRRLRTCRRSAYEGAETLRDFIANRDLIT